jgi:iron-sulfur cluster repair protein YtfE (RIC family)
MFGWFGRKKEEHHHSEAAVTRPLAPQPQTAPTHTAPGTQIGYHPQLIQELEHDHQQLLAVFTQITAAHKAGDLSKTASLLNNFRSGLSAHLLKENVRLYIYLERALAKDPSSHALVHQFRTEMDGIGKAVLDFLARYRHIADDPSLAGSFGADLAAIGNVLVQRIRSEEDTLYPLYLAEY